MNYTQLQTAILQELRYNDMLGGIFHFSKLASALQEIGQAPEHFQVVSALQSLSQALTAPGGERLVYYWKNNWRYHSTSPADIFPLLDQATTPTAGDPTTITAVSLRPDVWHETIIQCSSRLGEFTIANTDQGAQVTYKGIALHKAEQTHTNEDFVEYHKHVKFPQAPDWLTPGGRIYTQTNSHVLIETDQREFGQRVYHCYTADGNYLWRETDSAAANIRFGSLAG